MERDFNIRETTVATDLKSTSLYGLIYARMEEYRRPNPTVMGYSIDVKKLADALAVKRQAVYMWLSQGHLSNGAADKIVALSNGRITAKDVAPFIKTGGGVRREPYKERTALYNLFYENLPLHRSSRPGNPITLDVKKISADLNVSPQKIFLWLKLNSLPSLRLAQVVNLPGATFTVKSLVPFITSKA